VTKTYPQNPGSKTINDMADLELAIARRIRNMYVQTKGDVQAVADRYDVHPDIVRDVARAFGVLK
jgi:hypothetical protein